MTAPVVAGWPVVGRSPATPRPVRCVIEDRGRDLAVARAAKAGRFSHCGVTLQLGRRPDWIGGGTTDPEWRIEWVKLYEGMDLAYAFAETGDGEFLTAWEDLVESFCYQVPVGHDSSDVSARRIQNWLYAWQRFAADPGFSGLRPGLAELLVSRIQADAVHLAAHLTAERNHRTLELYALLLVGLAFEDDDAARYSLDVLAANAATDIWADGVHRECSTDYHLIVLRSLLGAIANARLFDLAVPAPLLRAADRACDFALHMQRPDGLTPALSDGDQGDFRTVLALGAELLDRAELRWAATGGAEGTPPAQRSADFPVGGYYTQRSGWGDEQRAYRHERWLVLDAGPLGDGGHGHYDQLSVEIAAAGRMLVLDPGRYTYDADDPAGWRHWFKGTAAHNTVCVDGLDQTPYRPGKPAKGAPTSTARLLGRWSMAGLDLLRAEVSSPCYDAVHTRTVAFVDGDYWVVHDRLRAPTRHSYAARWHLAPAAGGALSLGDGRLSAPGLLLLAPLGPLAVEDGWISASYGGKEAAPIAVLTAAGTDADLVTVLLPDDGGLPAGITASADCGADRVEVRVRRPGAGVDTLRWTTAGDVDWERTC